jgi:hypothetical protein
MMCQEDFIGRDVQSTACTLNITRAPHRDKDTITAK